MKIHKGIHYIKQDMWSKFLESYEQYGFKLNPRYIHPQAVTRDCSDEKWTQWIQINITEPCVNMWDREDKNGQREIWLWHNNFGSGNKTRVLPYVKDLVDAGFVEGYAADRADEVNGE